MKDIKKLALICVMLLGVRCAGLVSWEPAQRTPNSITQLRANFLTPFTDFIT
jgi:hypothetical protein